MSLGTGAVLALCGLAGGIGITGLGPGGVLVTVGLYTATDLAPGKVAGTGMAITLGTTLLGAAAYCRSGQLREPATRRLALLLGASALVATPVGVAVNAHLSGREFGTILGAATIAIAGAITIGRRRHGPDRFTTSRALVVGLVVGAVSGLFGLGGQLLSVPLLIVGGTPMLGALSAAQFQSVAIAGIGAAGYAARGDVSWALAGAISPAALIGALAGWRLARNVSATLSRSALIAALSGVGLYLVARGLAF